MVWNQYFWIFIKNENEVLKLLCERYSAIGGVTGA